MTKRILALVAGTAFTLATHADVDTESGNHFKSLCESPKTSLACTYWLDGLYDGVDYGRYIHTGGESLRRAKLIMGYCLPDGVTVGQMKAVFVKFLNDHPEELHEEASVLAIESWRLAWPCAEKWTAPIPKQ